MQIASGSFDWDEIIHALPEMKDDPCAVEIKYGQGAKPGDGGLLMWYKVNDLIAALMAMLNWCAPGVGVVDIDNGFGAGYLAALINQSEAK